MDHVAIDLGRRESQICVRSSTGEIQLEKRVRTTKLRDFLATLEPSRVILETCAEAFAVAVQAKEEGHDVRVVPATLVRSLGVGHRGIKTDQRDARSLSEASARVELSSVHVPSDLSREVKACAGMRDALVRSRTMLINTVRGWLRGQLIRALGGSTEKFPERVRNHFSANDLVLAPYVDRQLEAIEGLTERIREADLEIQELAKMSEDCRRLMTVPGIGPVTSVRFLASIDDVKRFTASHHLESYFGMTPGESSSSDTKRRTALTKAGSSAVRWHMVQAAWCAFRTRPNDPMVLWARRIAVKRSNHVAVVALARKMIGIMFALLRDGTTYKPGRASTVRIDMLEPLVTATGAEVVHQARAAQARGTSEETTSMDQY